VPTSACKDVKNARSCSHACISSHCFWRGFCCLHSGGVDAVREFLGMYSTPGLSSMAQSSSLNETMEDWKGPDALPVLPRTEGGYQPHERTASDLLASTHASCQEYNPKSQGTLYAHDFPWLVGAEVACARWLVIDLVIT